MLNGFEDYTIDTNGNIYSKRKKKYLKQTINKYGYCKVKLQKDNYSKIYSVHRLVAEAFISNPENKSFVNHIDCNKQNNKVSNLEWVTAKENTQHAVKNGLFDNMAKINSEKMKGSNGLVKYQGYKKANEVTRKKVAQYDKNNNIIKVYKSLTEASKETGINIVAISYSANGKRKTGGGFVWHFV